MPESPADTEKRWLCDHCFANLEADEGDYGCSVCGDETARAFVPASSFDALSEEHERVKNERDKLQSWHRQEYELGESLSRDLRAAEADRDRLEKELEEERAGRHCSCPSKKEREPSGNLLRPDGGRSISEWY